MSNLARAALLALVLSLGIVAVGALIVFSPGADAVDDCYGYGICR